MVMCIKKQVQRHAFPLNTIEEDPDYEKYRFPIVLIPTDIFKATFKANTSWHPNLFVYHCGDT